MTGAQFEVRIDGTRAPTATERTSRWRPGDKSKQPHSIVEVKDLQSGDVTAGLLKSSRCRPG